MQQHYKTLNNKYHKVNHVSFLRHNQLASFFCLHDVHLVVVFLCLWHNIELQMSWRPCLFTSHGPLCLAVRLSSRRGTPLFPSQRLSNQPGHLWFISSLRFAVYLPRLFSHQILLSASSPSPPLKFQLPQSQPASHTAYQTSALRSLCHDRHLTSTCYQLPSPSLSLNSQPTIYLSLLQTSALFLQAHPIPLLLATHSASLKCL